MTGTSRFRPRGACVFPVRSRDRIPLRLRVLPPLALVLIASVASADVVTLSAVRDNTLYKESGALSNGAGPVMFAGKTNKGSSGEVRRALVQFDLSAIPPTATVTNATLTLYMSRRKAGTFPIAAHRVLANWGEGTSVASGEGGKGAAATTGDATWTHRLYSSVAWTTPGGDFAPTASATTSVTAEGAYTWSSAALIADIQGWVANPANNNGWILLGDESQKTTARRFDTRSNGTVSHRPSLQVTYFVAAPTGVCCLPSDSCAVLSMTDCAAAGGVYQGDGTICSPDPCAPPTGACCLPSGDCDTFSASQCAAAGGTYHGDGTACEPMLCPVVLTPFVDALPRPAVATPTSGVAGGTASYSISITELRQRLHRDLPVTTVWGYAGSYPGPTIEARTGSPVTVTWINDLRDSLNVLRTAHYLPVDTCMMGPDEAGAAPRTVAHLHGGHVPPASDGYPEQTILPGEQQSWVYPNLQDAATLWYHDHALGITRLNVMMGLAGFYLVRDDVESALALPAGEFEIPLAIQDRTFRPDGSIEYPAAWEDHHFGDKILVNGKVWPYLEVKQGKYRFRLLNGSNSRVFTLALSNGAPFWMIGSDEGLLPAPLARTALTLTPGERADVVIDFGPFAAGTAIVMQNSAPAPYPGTPGEGVIPQVMQFRVVGTPGHVAALPSLLRPVVRMADSTAALTRDFLLEKMSGGCAGSMWMINGLGWHDVTEHPVLGTTEIWRFLNRSGMVHPMHMHLVRFQILDRQPFTMVGDSVVTTGPAVLPDSVELGWKDTAPVGPGEMLRVIARFEDYTGLYPYHCHILEHEDNEMMRQFEVVLPVAVAPAVTSAVPRLSRLSPVGHAGDATFLVEMPRPARAQVTVHDIGGRLIAVLANADLESGPHLLRWDGRLANGRPAASGMYACQLRVDGTPRGVQRLVFLR